MRTLKRFTPRAGAAGGIRTASRGGGAGATAADGGTAFAPVRSESLDTPIGQDIDGAWHCAACRDFVGPKRKTVRMTMHDAVYHLRTCPAVVVVQLPGRWAVDCWPCGRRFPRESKRRADMLREQHERMHRERDCEAEEPA